MGQLDQKAMEQYHSLLSKANTNEKKDPSLALELIQECIQLLEAVEDPSLRILNDKKTLTHRVEYLETKSSEKEAKAEINTERVEDDARKESETPEAIKSASETITETSKSGLGAVKAPKSQKSESKFFQKQYSPSVFDPMPDIVDEMIEALSSHSSIEYNEYITFYESVNDLHPQPLPPLLYQESDVMFYVGDTHGAFSETLVVLQYFERILKVPSDKQIILVFLGDYVDRNHNDLENLTLILAYWLKYPENIVILRGNHEDAKINAFYGFLNNLKDTFVIEEWVNSLMTEISTFFTKLPVVHVAGLNYSDKNELLRIFAAHGGIPIDTDHPDIPVDLTTLETKMEANAKSFEEFDKYMNWLLWADPKEDVDGILLRPEIGRHQFGLKPFEAFLETNNLQFMVRAHEVLKEGYKYFFNQQLISLFTASSYKDRPIGKAAFLRLEADKSPAILSTDPDMLDMDFEFWSKTLADKAE